MEIKNYRSSVSYSLVCYKENGTIEAEINYNVKKSDNKIIMSWIELVEESVQIDEIHILRTPTPLLEEGVLTYKIAYAKHKYTIEVRYLDNKLSQEIDDDKFVEQLTADLFEKSVRKLVEKAVHIPGIIESQGDGISLLISRHHD